MPATPEMLLALFDALGIVATTTGHAAVFTVEQGEAAWNGISGVHCKNLFLKDAKGRLWLVLAPHDRMIDLKKLPERIGSARLSFGSAPLLREVLGVEPGSVTPFALINDREKRVTVVLDSWLMAQPLVNFHPLTNTATTTLSSDDLRRFIRHCGHACMNVSLK